MNDFVPSDRRYRTVPEAAIVEMLLVNHWPFEVRAGAVVAARREARAAIDRWVSLGLPHAASPAGERLFDSVDVANFSSWAGLRHDDPVAGKGAETTRNQVFELHGRGHAGSSPPLLAELGPKRFAVTFKREFNLAGLPAGTRTRLRLPMPLEDEALRDLRLTVVADDELEPSYIPGGGRVDVQITTPSSQRAVVGFDAAFVACPILPERKAATLEPSERDLYTRPSEGIIRVTPRVRALAEELAGDESDDWDAVGRFWTELAGRMRFGAIHYDQAGQRAPLDWVLDQGLIDCRLGSALIAGLCRARGVPARLVSGYFLFVTAPVLHYWIEIWTPDRGWVPLDRCSWGMAGGGDASWRDLYFGVLDYRMKTESLPRLFNGGGVARFPQSWRQLVRLVDGGVETSYHDIETGDWVYKDHICVRPAANGSDG